MFSLAGNVNKLIALNEQKGTKPLKYTSGGHDSRLSKASGYANISKNPQPGTILKIGSYQLPTLTNILQRYSSYYQEPFHFIVTSNSPSQITLTSSDSTILNISGDLITFERPGTVTITIFLPAYVSGKQFGNFYEINKQTIFTILPTPTYILFYLMNQYLSLHPFTISATSNSKNVPIVYSISDTFIANFTMNSDYTFSTNSITMFDDGDVTITASQVEGNFYAAASNPVSITILPVENVNTFRYDYNYTGPKDTRNLYYEIENKNVVVNNTDNNVLFTTKQDFTKSNLVQVKYICYTGDLVIEQFTDP